MAPLCVGVCLCFTQTGVAPPRRWIDEQGGKKLEVVSRSGNVWPVIVLKHLLSILDGTVMQGTGMENVDDSPKMSHLTSLEFNSLPIKWRGGG